MHRQTKKTRIPDRVKQAVYERDDECCIICHSNAGLPNAHYIARSQGGMGIEENIVTLCPRCHYLYDNGGKRELYKKIISEHLKDIYPGWDEKNLIYRKELNR